MARWCRRPALATPRAILSEIREGAPEIDPLIGAAGWLCVRLVRGSAAIMFDHSRGKATDLTIGGALDRAGDERVQTGLMPITPDFIRHGWYWGASLPKEEAKHFEVGEALPQRWKAEGRLEAPARPEGPAPQGIGSDHLLQEDDAPSATDWVPGCAARQSSGRTTAFPANQTPAAYTRQRPETERQFAQSARQPG